MEKIVGDGRCDWSGGILQEGMILSLVVDGIVEFMSVRVKAWW